VLRKRAASRRLYKPDELQGGINVDGQIEDNKKLREQILFREKEVDNLHALIYGEGTTQP